MQTVTNPILELTVLGYDAAGRNTAKALPNGTTAGMFYDNAGNLDRVLNLNSGSVTISCYEFGFDGVGDRYSCDKVGEHYSNWQYDGTRQLLLDLMFGVPYGWARLTLPQ